MINDFFVIIYWWWLLFLLGVLAWPLSGRIFVDFWDKGWIFGKTIALVGISYCLLLLGRLHLLPFTAGSIFLLLGGLAGVNLICGKDKKRRRELKKLWPAGKVILGEESIFLLALLAWSFVRGFQPNIEGLEKFMDFGFLNSILRSKWFPPADMWFAGETINYYYFGHLQAAVLTKISGLDSAITYNLMIGTLFALAFTSTFSLASNLSVILLKKINRQVLVAGLISAFLLTLGGNLHTIVYVLKNGAERYWYPDATRFIGYQPNNPQDKTIHEFPAYSFVVADLHGHLNDLPTVLLFLATLLIFGLHFSVNKRTKTWQPATELFLLAFLLGTMYMTNSWDFPIYGLLFALFVFLKLIIERQQKLKEGLVQVFAHGWPVLLLAVIVSLPFSLSFKPMAQGIGLVRAHSLWWQLLILWGFFWFIAGSFWFLTAKKWHQTSDIFVLSLTLWATLLIFIPEIIYVKDIYIPEYHRANTMFKLVYQAFVMYALVAGYVLLRIKKELKSSRPLFYFLYFALFALGFAAQMIYPHFALRGYYGKLTPSRYRGLYGLEFLKTQAPDDYRAVLWLKENLKGQPVVLEAVGDSYTLYNRVSALTGLPTIEGWLVHEWLWRGGYDQPGKRAAEVEAIYQGEDEERAKELLRKYKVEYVFVGNLEREKYPSLRQERFSRLGKEVFSSGKTKIYRLPR